MNPDQTGSSLIWVHIVCKIGYLKEHKKIREQVTSLDWWAKGKSDFFGDKKISIHVFVPIRF